MNNDKETSQDIVEYKLNPLIYERFPNFDNINRNYQTEIIYRACLSITYPLYRQYINKDDIYTWYQEHNIKTFKGGG